MWWRFDYFYRDLQVLCEECHQRVSTKTVRARMEADVTLHRKINCLYSWNWTCIIKVCQQHGKIKGHCLVKRHVKLSIVKREVFY